MELKRFLFLLCIAGTVALLLRTFVFESIYIATGSMEPQLSVGAHVFMDKLTFNFRAPRHGEIIVFASPVSTDEDMVKRVIAIPGDTVEIKDKKVLLNGAVLDDDYVQHTRAKERLVGDNLGPITVPPDHVFVLGDNRDESNDSSVWKDPKTGERVYFVGYSAIRGIVRGFY